MEIHEQTKHLQKRQKYAIRKLNVGIASVLFGTFIYLSMADQIKAAEVEAKASSQSEGYGQGMADAPSETSHEYIKSSTEALADDVVPNEVSETADYPAEAVQAHITEQNSKETSEIKSDDTPTSSTVTPSSQETKSATVEEVGLDRVQSTVKTATPKQQEVASQFRTTSDVNGVPPVNAPAPQANTKQITVEGIKENVYQKSIPVLPDSKVAQTIGMGRGNSQGRESLGVIVPADTKVYIRQAKSTNESDVRVNLMTDDGVTNKTVVVPRDGSCTNIETSVDSAAFIYLQRGLSSEPLVEFYVENNHFQALPTYRKGQNQETFETQWVDQDASYAFVDGEKHAILIPRVDRDRVLAMKTNTSKYGFKNLDEFITYYDDVITHYDQWVGLNDDPQSVNYNIGHKYFTTANKHGFGLAYWSGDHMGMNGPSVYGYLDKGWLILHEIGHGYDGVMIRDNNVQLIEVINNVLAHQYEQTVQKLGSDWLYQNNAEALQKRIHEKYFSSSKAFNFNSLDAKEKLDFVTRMTRLTGFDALSHMYQHIRKQSATEGLPADVPRWLGEYLLAENGANGLAYFDLYHIPTSPQLKERLNQYNNSYVYPLAMLISDEAERQKYVERLNLKTIYELVKSSDLKDTVIQAPATVTLNLNGQQLAPHSKVLLKDGKDIVAEAEVINGEAVFNHVRAGVYKVLAPSSTTLAIPDYAYMVVRESGENSVTLNYPELEGTQTNVTQQIAIKGLGNNLVSSITYHPATKEVIYRHTNGQPHVYFGEQEYAHVTIRTQQGEVLRDQSFLGNERLSEEQQTFTMNYGDTITVMHREAESRRQVIRMENGERLAMPDERMQTVTYTLTDKGFIVNNETEADAESRYVAMLEGDIQHMIARMDAYPERDYRVQLHRIAQGIQYTNRDDEKRLREMLSPYLEVGQLAAPKVQPVQLDQRYVYGTATPNATITIVLPAGESYTTKTSEQGRWSITIPTETPLKVDDIVYVQATLEGLQDAPEVTTKVIDTIAPNIPNIFIPQAKSQNIKGSAQPGVKVFITFANGQVVETVASEQGVWSVLAPAPLQLGESISVYAEDANGNTSGSMSVQVIDTIPPNPPGATNLEYGKSIIRGTGEAHHNQILVRFPDGQIDKTLVGKKGTWMIGVPYESYEKLKVGDVIQVFEYDASNNRSQPTYIYVVDTTPPLSPQVNVVTEGESEISGTSEPYSIITITMSNGDILEGKTNEEGRFVISIPENIRLTDKDELIVVATDSHHNSSEPTVVIVKFKEEEQGVEGEPGEVPVEPSEPAPEIEEGTGEVPVEPSEPAPEVEEETGEVPVEPSEPAPEIEEGTGEVPVEPSEPAPEVEGEPGEVPVEPSEPAPEIEGEPGEVPVEPSEPAPEIEEGTGEVLVEPSETDTKVEKEAPEASLGYKEHNGVSPVISTIDNFNHEVYEPSSIRLNRSQSTIENEASKLTRNVNSQNEMLSKTKRIMVQQRTMVDSKSVTQAEKLPETGQQVETTKVGILLSLLGVPLLVRALKRRKASK
ncbi:Ig-like domain-containing protein [Staphylococcus ratti]|uniref:Ig-like domain-containing protein n=1 Tax=Staphylococcus ratti TaxID=2892440 RepID=A0ABY3PDP9_9STAP|nr:Ig-like domain-containing protein [Staphylococcus ratti]UEX90396.1 Ig-like domain-containing protein [Staphylococcus ratti]